MLNLNTQDNNKYEQAYEEYLITCALEDLQARAVNREGLDQIKKKLLNLSRNREGVC